MTYKKDISPICSVSKLAQLLGMSRSRFYQLQKKGIFPQPIYCIDTQRPLYPLQLQHECLAIRKSGIGYNGKSIIFYSTRKQKHQSNGMAEYKPIVQTLKQMGLTVTPKQVKTAMATLYPDGPDGHQDTGKVILEVYRFLCPKR